MLCTSVGTEPMVQSSGSVRFGKSLSSVRFRSVSQTISVRSVRFVFAKKQGFEFGSGSVRFPSLVTLLPHRHR